MSEENFERTIFRYMCPDDQVWFYCSYVARYSDGDWCFSSTRNLSEAVNVFDSYSVNEDCLFEALMAYGEYAESTDVEIAKMNITIDAKAVDSDMIREAKQRIALKKLNNADIEILGLSSLATYIKTKYH